MLFGRSLAIVCFVALAGSVAGAATVTLENGDVLEGEVVSLDANEVVIEHPVLGTVTVAADRVEAIEGVRPGEPDAEAEPAEADEAEDEASGKAPGTPGASDADAESAETDDGNGNGGADPEAEEATPAEPMETQFLPAWDKTLSVGVNGKEGNTQSLSFNTQLKLTRETDRHRFEVEARYFYTQNDGERTQNEFRSQATRDWLDDDSPWIFFVRGGYEYDEFESWEHRLRAYAGPGYRFVDNEDFELLGRLGVGANYEFGTVNELTPEGLLGSEIVRWHITENQTFEGELTVYPDLEELGEYRLTAKAEWQVEIDRASGLSLKLGVENQYESVTEGDDQHNDLKYYGALNYSF